MIASFSCLIYVVIIVLVLSVKESRASSDSYSEESGTEDDQQNKRPKYKTKEFDLGGSFRKSFALEALSQGSRSLVCSPVSAMIPLAKLALGAEGRCESELLEMIGVQKKAQIKHTFRKIINELKYLPGVKLTVASRIFVSDKFKINKKFQHKANKIFRSSLEKINLDNLHEAKKRINEWIAKETGKTSVSKKYDLSGHPVSVIMNIVTFLGDWEKKFRKVTNAEFHSPTGVRNVSMMSRQDFYNYAKSEALKAQVIEIPYKREKASFIVVLPFSKTGLPELLRQLKGTPELLNDALKNTKTERVILTIPKFRTETGINLLNMYKNIGLYHIFRPKSGLTGIIKDEELAIGRAFQHTVIDVNEKGTEGVAATAVEMVQVSHIMWLDQVIFNANHPFLFYVKSAKEQLFAGVYYGNE